MRAATGLRDRRAVPGLVLAALAALGVCGVLLGVSQFSPHAKGPGAFFVIAMLAFAGLSGLVAVGGLIAASRHRVALALVVETMAGATAGVAVLLWVAVNALPRFPVFWPTVALVLAANVAAVVVARRRVVPWFERSGAS